MAATLCLSVAALVQAETVWPVSVAGWVGLVLSVLAIAGVLWQRARKEALGDRLTEEHETRLQALAAEHERQLTALRVEREQRLAEVTVAITAGVETFRGALTSDLNGARQALTSDINGMRQALTADLNGLRTAVNQELNGYGRRLDQNEERVEVMDSVLNGALQTLAAMQAEVRHTRESAERIEKKLDRFLERPS